jgi:site-specific DNA-adenine methylase
MPFLGGGTLELQLASRGYKVQGCTNFRLLYDFWDCMSKEPERVYEMSKAFYPVDNKKLFHMLQKKVYSPHDAYIRSALFYVLNLCSIDGTATSGELEPNTPRFTELRLSQLAHYTSENFMPLFVDHKTVLSETNQFVVATPPPYLSTSFINAINIPEKPQIDHKEFAQLIKQKQGWVLLYNYHAALPALYNGHVQILLDEAARPTKDPAAATEVLILGS